MTPPIAKKPATASTAAFLINNDIVIVFKIYPLFLLMFSASAPALLIAIGSINPNAVKYRQLWLHDSSALGEPQ
jgi:hypothetical protein